MQYFLARGFQYGGGIGDQSQKLLLCHPLGHSFELGQLLVENLPEICTLRDGERVAQLAVNLKHETVTILIHFTLLVSNVYLICLESDLPGLLRPLLADLRVADGLRTHVLPQLPDGGHNVGLLLDHERGQLEVVEVLQHLEALLHVGPLDVQRLLDLQVDVDQLLLHLEPAHLVLLDRVLSLAPEDGLLLGGASELLLDLPADGVGDELAALHLLLKLERVLGRGALPLDLLLLGFEPVDVTIT